MATSNVWHTLPLSRTELPPLLVKCSLLDDGYCVQLTDLSRLWEERLTKTQIIARAEETGCSIDPSEDDQYIIMLSKIADALRGETGTNLNLCHTGDDHGLRLGVSSPLPGSLPTFHWTIQLSKMAVTAIAAELVTPLLVQANTLQHQIRHLIDELSSKDRVIAKVADRLEASGNDLAAVFPGVSNVKTNRKKSQRAQLANHVKGLAEFDENKWRTSVAERDGPGILSLTVIDEVLKSMRTSHGNHAPVDPPVDWWRRLHDPGKSGEVRQAELPSRQTSTRRYSPRTTAEPVTEHESIQDERFQRQPTPPHLKTADENETSSAAVNQGTLPVSTEEDEADESTDDDLDAPSRTSSSQTKGRSQQDEHVTSVASTAPTSASSGGERRSTERLSDSHSAKSPLQHNKPSKLGAIGGKAKSPSVELGKQPYAERGLETAQQDESKPRQQSRLGTFGGRTSPDRDIDVPNAPGSPVKKTKLGAFGGAARDKIASSKQEHNKERLPQEPSNKEPALGKFGGGKVPKADSDVVAVEHDRAHQPRAQGEHSVECEREESPETADMKRERLKRELEEKSKVPAKKKRRF